MVKFAAFCVGVVGFGSCYALDVEPWVDLSVKTTALGFAQSNNLPAQAQGAEYLLTTQVSGYLNLVAYFGDATELNFRYGLQGVSQLDDEQTEAGAASANYRTADLPSEIEWRSFQDLDLLNIVWYGEQGTYVLGRQPIAFGQAKIYSPIDVIQPATLIDSSSSYRAGVDALRGTWAVGSVSELDAGVVFGEAELMFARFKAYAFSADWELIAMRMKQDKSIISLGTNGGVGPYGLWQETALLTGDEQAVRATVGIDYTFFDDLYAFAELHYNGIGEAENYAATVSKDFYQLGAVAPLGQWYSSVQGSYPIHIATQLNVGATMNLNDASVLLNSTLSYNASDALSVQLNAALPVVSEVSLAEEMSVYPALISLNLDWVF